MAREFDFSDLEDIEQKPKGKFDLTREFYERARRSDDPLGYDDYQEVKDRFGMYAPIVAQGAKTGDALLRGIMSLGYGASGLVGDITDNELLARDLAGMFESAGGRMGSSAAVTTAPYRAGATLGKAKVKQVADDVASDIKYAPEIIKGEASSVALGAKQPPLTSAGAKAVDDFVYQPGLKGQAGFAQKKNIFDRIINNPEKKNKFIDMIYTNPGRYDYNDIKAAFPEFKNMNTGTFRKEYLTPLKNELTSKGLAKYDGTTQMLLDTGAMKEIQKGYLGPNAVNKIIKLHGEGVSPSAIVNTLEGTVPISGQALYSNVINYTKRNGFLDTAFKKDPDFFGKNYKPKYADEKIIRPKATSGQGKKFAIKEIDETWFDPGVADGFFLHNIRGTPLNPKSISDKLASFSGAGKTKIKKIFPFLRASPGTSQRSTTASIALLPESGHRFPGVTSIKMNDPLQYTDVKIQTTAINQKLFASQKGGSLDGLINNKVETIQQLLKSKSGLKDPDILAAVNKNIDDINKVYDETYEMMYKTFGDRMSRDVFPTLSIQGDRLVLTNPRSLLTPKSTTQFFKDYFYDVAATLNLSDDVARLKFNMTADDMLNQFRLHAKNNFPNASTKVWEDIVASLRKALKETDETKKLKLFDKADELIEEAAKKADAGERLFNQGGRAGYQEGGLVKLNPADYIEYYRDGTKLYKINSFIRDIARQIA